MNTRAEFTAPNGPSSQLIKVSAFIHQHVASQYSITSEVIAAYLNLTHFREIQISILNICNSEVMNADRVTYLNI